MKYLEFLKSNEWKKKKDMLSRYQGGKECFICGSKKDIDCHHRSYTRWGKEKMKHIVFLCRKCHFEIHRFANCQKYSYGKAIKKATQDFKQGYILRNGFVWGKREIADYLRGGKVISDKLFRKLKSTGNLPA